MLPALWNPGYSFSVIPGLSGRGLAAIARLERGRLLPGAAAELLLLWEEMVRHPAHRVRDLEYLAGDKMFARAPAPYEVRALLELVCRALPKQDARRFRRRLATLDEMW